VRKTALQLFIVFLPTQLSLHLWPNWALVNGLRVDYLAPFLLATDALFALIFVLFRKEVVAFFKEHRRSAFTLLLILTINVLVSTAPFVSLFWWLRVLQALITFAIFSSLKNPLAIISTPLSIVLIGVGALSLAQFAAESSLGGLLYFLGERRLSVTTPGVARVVLDSGTYLRPYATFSHPNAMAGFVGLVLLIKLKPSRFKLPGAAFGLLALALSFSKLAIVAFIAALLLEKLPARQNIPIALGVLVSLGLLFFNFDNAQYGPSIAERLFLIERTREAMLSSAVFGAGLGGFVSTLPPGTRLLQPVHNVFLLALSELGIVAWSMAALVFLKGLSHKAFLGATIFMAITALGDHYWYTAVQTRLLAAVVLAVIMRSGKVEHLL